MMERLHVTDDPANIGYYSGLVESCFAIAELLTVSIAPFHPHSHSLIIIIRFLISDISMEQIVGQYRA